MNKVGIIGSSGFVGTAMQKIFPEASLYDINLPLTKMRDINKCEIAIVCVPTPNNQDGSLNIDIVEEVVKECKSSYIVIRSTLQPGTADYLERKYNKNIILNPEYVGEGINHPLLDESNRDFFIIGGRSENRRKLIELYQTVYNANINIRLVSNLEAEVIKLSENRMIAFKVAQCQELYDVCEKAGVDYYVVREAVYSDDPRANLWWTFVYSDKRGFNSSCIPKDILAWRAWAESLGYDPKITKVILEKNKEWLKLNK